MRLVALGVEPLLPVHPGVEHGRHRPPRTCQEYLGLGGQVLRLNEVLLDGGEPAQLPVVERPIGDQTGAEHGHDAGGQRPHGQQRVRQVDGLLQLPVQRAGEAGGVGGGIRDLEATGPPPHHPGNRDSRSAARKMGDGRPQRVGRAAHVPARVLKGLPQDLPSGVRELRIRVKDRARRAVRGLLGLRHRFLPLY
uniref:hypothetical protein n=1 Tax=Streptomyces sp. F8 TaxID=1436085 RepID=UPI0015E84D46|nr:hypothetical protein [Streptomyces sp. F8]